MKQHSNTNINYTFSGAPVDTEKHPFQKCCTETIEGWRKDVLATVLKTGQFVYHVPEMWEKTAKSGGYDIVCKVEKIEKVTEVKTWTHEDINLEDLARDLQ